MDLATQNDHMPLEIMTDTVALRFHLVSSALCGGIMPFMPVRPVSLRASRVPEGTVPGLTHDKLGDR